jgi:hypothetical protein
VISRDRWRLYVEDEEADRFADAVRQAVRDLRLRTQHGQARSRALGYQRVPPPAGAASAVAPRALHLAKSAKLGGSAAKRSHSRMRTRRLAHGLTEFLCDYQLKLGDGTRSLVVHNADAADPTDAELLAILLRRIDPGLLTLVVCTGDEVKHAMLAAALTAHASSVRGVVVAAPAVLHGATAELAARYVDSECTDDRPELIAAYQGLPQGTRARLHDERAAALIELGEFSLSLGALPLHRERGSDPAHTGAAALQVALNHCFDMSFYEAAVDLGRRGREVIDWSGQAELWWLFTKRLGHSLAARPTGRGRGNLPGGTGAQRQSRCAHDGRV